MIDGQVALHDKATDRWSLILRVEGTLSEGGTSILKEYLKVVVAEVRVVIEASVVLPCDAVVAEGTLIVLDVLVVGTTEPVAFMKGAAERARIEL